MKANSKLIEFAGAWKMSDKEWKDIEINLDKLWKTWENKRLNLRISSLELKKEAKIWENASVQDSISFGKKHKL